MITEVERLERRGGRTACPGCDDPTNPHAESLTVGARVAGHLLINPGDQRRMNGGTSTSSSGSSVTGTARLGSEAVVAADLGPQAPGGYWAPGARSAPGTGAPAAAAASADSASTGSSGSARAATSAPGASPAGAPGPAPVPARGPGPTRPTAVAVVERVALVTARGSSFLWVGAPASNPAAITVTRTSSPSESSMTVPKMMLASGCADSCTSDAASLISNKAQVGAARDGEQHAVRAVHGRFEQRRVDRLLRGLDGSALAARRADAHQGAARVGHDALDVGEVQVDQTGGGDQVGDALDTGEEDLVR